MNSSGAEAFALVRLAESLFHVHPAPRVDLARRAKVASCPCCTMATHSALPPTYAPGAFNFLAACVLDSWEIGGPWAPRRSAARQFARTYVSSPKGRDWAAQSLFLSVPEPFCLANPPKDPMRAHVLTPLRVPKHSPPSPTVETQPGATSPLVAKASPPSPLLSPSEPVAMNSSESASPPSQEVCAIHPKQDPPFGRVRVP